MVDGDWHNMASLVEGRPEVDVRHRATAVWIYVIALIVTIVRYSTRPTYSNATTMEPLARSAALDPCHDNDLRETKLTRTPLQPSQKTFRIKQRLAKASRQNRPIPQWFRYAPLVLRGPPLTADHSFLPGVDSRLTARSSTTPSEGIGDERSSTFKRVWTVFDLFLILRTSPITSSRLESGFRVDFL